MGRKAPALEAVASSSAPTLHRDQIASRHHSVVQLLLKGDMRPNPSHAQQNNTVAFSIWLPTRKGLFLGRGGHRVHLSMGFSTDVDTVCCGLRCPSKDHCFPCVFTVVEFFPLFIDGSRSWIRGKAVKDLRIAVSTPGGLFCPERPRQRA